MTVQKLINSDPLFSPKGAALYIGSRNGSTALRDKLRCYGGGPKFIKIGKSVRYRMSALDIWLNERERVSTSDPGSTVATGA